MIGSADMLIATEKASILNVLEYAKPDRSSKIIIATYEKKSQSSEDPSEEYLFKVLEENSDYIYIVPVMQIANKFNNLKIINTVILGYILRFLPLSAEDLKEAINQHFKVNMLEINQIVFSEGITLK